MNLYERKHVMKAGSNERIKITACKNMENITMSNFYKKHLHLSFEHKPLNEQRNRKKANRLYIESFAKHILENEFY